MRNEPRYEPLVLSAKEAATMLGVSERTLWSLTKSGEVPSLKIGRLTKYRRETLADWLKGRETGGVSQ